MDSGHEHERSHVCDADRQEAENIQYSYVTNRKIETSSFVDA